jgi:uncharacterized protein
VARTVAGVTAVEELTGRLRADLTAAMRRRDQPAVRALRTLLGAVANAEAPPIDDAPLEVHGALVQHERRDIGADELRAIVAQQIADRVDTIATYRANGRDDAADELQREVDVLTICIR